MGLESNPPDKAIVLCVDEKSQTQALEPSTKEKPDSKDMWRFVCLPITSWL